MYAHITQAYPNPLALKALLPTWSITILDLVMCKGLVDAIFPVLI